MWEYLSVRINPPFDGSFPMPAQVQISERGREGWELVTTTLVTTGAFLLLFKRPVPEDRSEPELLRELEYAGF